MNNATEFKPMKQVLVRAEPNASKRTKNRVRENGPEFMMEKMTQDQILLHSKSTDWIGWLPKSEIFFRIDNDWI